MALNEIHIALAEDCFLIRQLLISSINSFLKCKVVADASNGKGLIAAIQQLETVPDICVMDISMPEMNGYDTVAYLKKSYPTMKFLILTVMEKEYSIITMIKNGANGYLLKGCKLDELYKAIVAIHSDGFYYSTTASEKAFQMVKHNKYEIHFTEKEHQFLSLCCSALSFCEIAKRMYISTRTVEKYQRQICEKLNMHTRIDLALFAIQTGLVHV